MRSPNKIDVSYNTTTSRGPPRLEHVNYLSMKFKLIMIGLLTFYNLSFASSALSRQRAELIAQAIYRSENAKKYPYGIKSINTHSEIKLAHNICIKTINNNYNRWQKTNQEIDFISYLSSIYCPRGKDKLNDNWITNVKYWINKYENRTN